MDEKSPIIKIKHGDFGIDNFEIEIAEGKISEIGERNISLKKKFGFLEDPNIQIKALLLENKEVQEILKEYRDKELKIKVIIKG